MAGLLSTGALFAGILFHYSNGNIENTGAKIIGGTETVILEYPYLVSLQYNGTFYGYDFEHFCGGVIVNEWWILTAAKCIHKKRRGDFHIRVGSGNYYKDGVIHEIDRILIHPRYTEIQWDYDVGVVKVENPIKFGSTSRPARLPAPYYEVNAGTELIIAGWGATAVLGAPSPVITASILPIIRQEECRNYYGNDSITGQMFCVYREGEGPCVGDTGSPGLVDNTIIGLASWSESCSYSHPAVYTNLGTAVDWINQVTQYKRM